jgi:hypothetical protein
MVKTIFFVLTSLLVSQGWSQGISITGKVLDEKSKEPLAFAAVSILGHALGTVTNVHGEFDFYIAEKYRNDSLLISHVGYQSYKTGIGNVKGNLAIALLPKPILLEEVVIHEKNLTAHEIVAKAVSRLTVNYSTTPFCLQGFFREIEQENGKYVMLTEAAVDLYDKNFDGKPKRHFQEAVDIREMRRSLRQSGRNSRDNIGMALADLIENNDVRYNRGMLNLSRNTFSLDTVMLYRERPVYGITMKNQIDSGTLYIDAETYGFVKISMERKSRDKTKKYYHEGPGYKGQKNGLMWFRFSIEFEGYDNKLYPRRMHESELIEIYDVATGIVKTSFIETLEFIITDIIPDRTNPKAKPLKYGMMIKPTEYHPAFWKTYNTLKLTPLDEKLIRDLEQEVSLEKQFGDQDRRKGK